MRALLILVALTGVATADDPSVPRPSGRGTETPDNDKVALLPLDADAKLQIYGQPVASEIAQALIAGRIDVVVVLPKMAVPEHTKLIVDGKIAGAKGGAID